MPISEPIFVSKLVIEAKDKDVLFDDCLGSIMMRISDVKTGHFAKPFWTHIYGAPPDSNKVFNRGEKKQVLQEMNKYPKIGSSNLTPSILLQRFHSFVDPDVLRIKVTLRKQEYG